MRKTSLLSLIVASAACNVTPPAAQSSPQGASPAIQASSAGQFPLVLAQTSLHPGTTSVDPSAASIMFANSNSQPIADPSALAGHFTLSDDAGNPVAIHLQLIPSKGPVTSPILVVSPDAALQQDRWYVLRVQQDGDLQISNDRLASDIAARAAGTWSSSFFTGSAPRIRAILRPTGAKDGAYVRLMLSEPVRLEDLDPATLVSFGARRGASCILQNGKCASTLKDVVADIVDIAPMAPFGATPGTLRVSLGANVRGAGRTVGEALAPALAPALTRKGLPSLAADHWALDIASNKWNPCHEGAAMCWSAQSE